MRVEQQIEFEAQSDAEAFAIARERLGRDATILSTRPVKLGGFLGMFKRDALWVTAGILVQDPEDVKKESHDRMMAFQHLLDVRRAVSGETASTAPASDVQVTSAFTPTPTKAAAAAYEANSKPQGEHAQLSNEVAELKDALSKVIARLDGGGAQPDAEQTSEAQDQTTSAEIHKDETAARLIQAEVDPKIANAIADEFNARGRGKSFEEWLAGIIPVAGTDTASALGGKKVLFAGPTGVGKTTTIAKIASEQSLWEDRSVVLMTADTYRIAAVEQLRTYAKILGVPIEIVPEPKDVQTALKKYREADLILLDTAGRSHFDGSRMEELSALYEAFSPDAVHLVMASNVKYRDMLDIIERMGVVPLSSLLFTKLDETSSYGIILNVLRDLSLPLSFLTTGQNVPNDIEVARGDRFASLLLNIDSVKRE